MYYRNRILTFLLSYFCSIALVHSQTTICFNEIMQSNIDCLFSNNDFPDSWIELYNSSDTSIDLFQYTICANNDPNKKYVIPIHSTIKSKGYLVVYCDKENSGLHTNFRLESTQSGSISLFDNKGSLIDYLEYPEMIAPNVGYGKSKDNNWGWEVESTPSSKNTGKQSDFLLPEPQFSAPGSLLNHPIELSITLPSKSLPNNAKIYYTTDGAEPTLSSNCGTTISLSINSNYSGLHQSSF